METKKKFRPGTEEAGKKSSYNKLRRIRNVMRSWKNWKGTSSERDLMEMASPSVLLNRIENILED